MLVVFFTPVLLYQHKIKQYSVVLVVNLHIFSTPEFDLVKLSVLTITHMIGMVPSFYLLFRGMG